MLQRVPKDSFHKRRVAMSQTANENKARFDELKPGDRVEVEHMVTVGRRSWPAKTSGTVVRIERNRHGLHFHRNFDDKVQSDAVLLEANDGELTSVTLDEFTAIRWI